jgi:NAD-dependent dihydropyrimidine dehydrogenase PreA subunit
MSTGPVSELSPIDELDGDDLLGWKEEGLFVRDLDGRLIRYDAPTHNELDRKVNVTIDGIELEVMKAVPASDEMGNLRHDNQGLVIPRATTIYDAVSQLYERLGSKRSDTLKEQVEAKEGEPENGASSAEEYKRLAGDVSNPIPILCHMKYMEPVAVCRLCVVQIARFRRRTGKIEVDDKLVPACQHRVEEGMIIDTIASKDREASARIERAVKTLLSLLMADHPTPCAKERQIAGDCELEALARRFQVPTSPFDPRRQDLPLDNTSLVIAVDHNACILCDRCIRGCDCIKENNVLGRMGKGYTARIAFDLDATMGRSTCVACGECMVSCPTGALTFKETIVANWFEEERPGESQGTRRRGWGWLDWLTFGIFRPQARPLERAGAGASPSNGGATR